MSKYGEALGVWEIRINGAEVDVKPTLDDAREFRNIMAKLSGKRDQMFNAVENFVIRMIKRDNPEDDNEEITRFVCLNFLPILKDVMIVFRMASKEDMAKVDNEAQNELKNLIGGDLAREPGSD